MADAVKLGNLNIAPIIYVSYFEKESNQIVRYMVMEKYDMTLKELLLFNRSKNMSTEFWKSSADIIKKLIEKMADTGFYCIDIKPRNCVFKKANNEYRMIDFDRNGCLEEKSLNKNEKCAVMLYLMAIHLGYSHNRQNIFATIAKDLIKKDKGPLSLGIQLKTFFNSYIRQGTAITGTKRLANNFEVYFRDRLRKEIDSKKTQAAKQKYEEILEKGMKILRPNRDGLYFAIATYITFQSAKAVLLNKLNTIQSIGSFLRTKRGYKVTNPEGYVAIKKGGAVKLVDRLEFSRANFTMAKDWVKG